MTRRSQLNFRLSPEEIDEFKEISQGFGMSTTEYFRAKFLDIGNGGEPSPLISIEELERRAKLAEKIIKQHEIDKNPGKNRLTLLNYSNLINLKIEEIAAYVSRPTLVHQDAAKVDEVIKMLSNIQQYIDGEFSC
ncbi:MULTISPECIES: hypothetical protein [unclassified Duganella]|uniref:hypothetical protein n=1 Tax=unclassified Duganella TaxID=2636909 RepID=UPI001113B74A|nr:MULTISPECIES: hypothetical protein [unclassified Duganella]